MTEFADGEPRSLVLRIAGRPVRMSDPAQLRKAVAHGDVTRADSISIQHRDGTVESRRADTVEELAPLFDEFDPLPPAPAPEPAEAESTPAGSDAPEPPPPLPDSSAPAPAPPRNRGPSALFGRMQAAKRLMMSAAARSSARPSPWPAPNPRPTAPASDIEPQEALPAAPQAQAPDPRRDRRNWIALSVLTLGVVLLVVNAGSIFGSGNGSSAALGQKLYLDRTANYRTSPDATDDGAKAGVLMRGASFRAAPESAHPGWAKILDGEAQGKFIREAFLHADPPPELKPGSEREVVMAKDTPMYTTPDDSRPPARRMPIPMRRRIAGETASGFAEFVYDKSVWYVRADQLRSPDS